MCEVRDYGFATFLFMNNYSFVVNDKNIALFNITPNQFENELKKYRQSVFYNFDINSKKLKKQLQSLKTKN